MLFEYFFGCFILVSMQTATEMKRVISFSLHTEYRSTVFAKMILSSVFVVAFLPSVSFIAWNLSLVFYRYFLQQAAITQLRHCHLCPHTSPPPCPHKPSEQPRTHFHTMQQKSRTNGSAVRITGVFNFLQFTA